MVTGKGTVLQKAKVSGHSRVLQGHGWTAELSLRWGPPSDVGGTFLLRVRALLSAGRGRGWGFAVSLALTNQKGACAWFSVLTSQPEGA